MTDVSAVLNVRCVEQGHVRLMGSALVEDSQNHSPRSVFFLALARSAARNGGEQCGLLDPSSEAPDNTFFGFGTDDWDMRVKHEATARLVEVETTDGDLLVRPTVALPPGEARPAYALLGTAAPLTKMVKAVGVGVQQTRAISALWKQSELLEFTLSIPVAEMVKARDKLIDETPLPFPADPRKLPAYPGQLTLDGVSYQGEVSMRGNSSFAEYAVPKLRFCFAEKPTEGAFQGMRRLQIATHGFRKDQGPHREVALYQVLAAMGIPTLLARAANVTMQDTNGKSEVRSSLLLEDKKDAAARFCGKRVEPEDISKGAKVRFTKVDIIRTELVQLMMGNNDFVLNYTPTGDIKELWNLDAIQTPTGSTPLIHDLDRSAFVLIAKLSPKTMSTFQSRLEFYMDRNPKETKQVLDGLLAKQDAALKALLSAELPSQDREGLTTYLSTAFSVIRRIRG